MKVWRIRNNEKGSDTYLGHLCSSKEAACILLIHLIDDLFRENGWDYKEKYTYIEKVDVRENGHWIHKGLALDWQVVETDYETDDERERKILAPANEDDNWYSIEEEGLLEDGALYDIELDLGEIVYAQIFDESLGTFGEGIDIGDVKGFRRVTV